jgi:hypothetical protein
MVSSPSWIFEPTLSKVKGSSLVVVDSNHLTESMKSKEKESKKLIGCFKCQNNINKFGRKSGGALRSSLITIENSVINLFKPYKYLLRRWLCFDLIKRTLIFHVITYVPFVSM